MIFTTCPRLLSHGSSQSRLPHPVLSTSTSSCMCACMCAQRMQVVGFGKKEKANIRTRHRSPLVHAVELALLLIIRLPTPRNKSEIQCTVIYKDVDKECMVCGMRYAVRGRYVVRGTWYVVCSTWKLRGMRYAGCGTWYAVCVPYQRKSRRRSVQPEPAE